MYKCITLSTYKCITLSLTHNKEEQFRFCVIQSTNYKNGEMIVIEIRVIYIIHEVCVPHLAVGLS